MRSWQDERAAEVGAWIAEARRLGRYSQAGLAERVGVSQSTISRLERGLTPGAHLRKVAPILILLKAELVVAAQQAAGRDRERVLEHARIRMADAGDVRTP